MCSAHACGCDPEASWVCDRHRLEPGEIGMVSFQPPIDPRFIHFGSALPTTDTARKALPIWSGVLMYFPDALLAVARVSQVGNDQHNPGEPLHWDRTKSRDQMNTALRHMLDYGLGNPIDTDGTEHLAKAAWRILAELQVSLEARKGQ